jgi:transcriptional regulator of acetoin/glycerol metabolism
MSTSAASSSKPRCLAGLCGGGHVRAERPKELVARAIHARSERRGQAFVTVNVTAIPEALVESEVLSHERVPSPAAPACAAENGSNRCLSLR